MKKKLSMQVWESGLAANSISSYVRAFKSFLTWRNEEGYSFMAFL